MIEKQNLFIDRSGGSLIEIDLKALEQISEIDKTPTAEITKKMLLEKRSLEEVATTRSLTLGTIITHLESIKKLDNKFDFLSLDIIPKTLNKTKIAKIKKSLKINEGKLSPTLFELQKLGVKTNYEEIRLVRLL